MITISRQTSTGGVASQVLRIDDAQNLEDSERIQAQQNAGLVYDASRGGYVATIAPGQTALIIVNTLPE